MTEREASERLHMEALGAFSRYRFDTGTPSNAELDVIVEVDGDTVVSGPSILPPSDLPIDLPTPPAPDPRGNLPAASVAGVLVALRRIAPQHPALRSTAQAALPWEHLLDAARSVLSATDAKSWSEARSKLEAAVQEVDNLE